MKITELLIKVYFFSFGSGLTAVLMGEDSIFNFISYFSIYYALFTTYESIYNYNKRLNNPIVSNTEYEENSTE